MIMSPVLSPVLSTVIVSEGFSPTDIPNLVLWLDASDPATIIASGDFVSQWSDKSGQANHAVQGTGADQPRTGINSTNSLNVITFDGINDFLDTQSVLISGTTGRTIFFVARADSTGPNDGIIALNSNLGTGSRYDVMAEVSVRINGGFILFDDNINDVTNYSVLMIQSAASSDVNVTLGVLNGTTMGVNSIAIRAINSGTQGTTRIGTRNNEVDFFEGDIGEIIVYDRALDPSEITLIETHLGKWGVPIS